MLHLLRFHFFQGHHVYEYLLKLTTIITLFHIIVTTQSLFQTYRHLSYTKFQRQVCPMSRLVANNKMPDQDSTATFYFRAHDMEIFLALAAQRPLVHYDG